MLNNNTPDQDIKIATMIVSVLALAAAVLVSALSSFLAIASKM
jgi:hypothetical protein